jgi:phosphoribosyl-ATP pyrophosphohydrolase
LPDFTLADLAATVRARAHSGDPSSYTAKLMAKGSARIAKKFGEEAVEAVIAAVERDNDALVSESADVLYHLAVLLESRGVSFDAVFAELARRTAQTGLQEKASRPVE